jgi:hypothetical protein
MKTLSPVRLDMIHLCAEWEDKDGKTLDKMDVKLTVGNWTFPVEVAELIDEYDEIDYDTILEVIKDYEEVKESESNEDES